MRELYDKLHALMEEGDKHPLATRVTVTFTKVELMQMVSLAAKERAAQARAEKAAAKSIKAVARATDPSESHDAAKKVRVARDRRLMLEAFSKAMITRGPITYREAAEIAEPGAVVSRQESLRRRGSDLSKFGWIEQYGRRGNTTEGIFALTVRGQEVVSV